MPADNREELPRSREPAFCICDLSILGGPLATLLNALELPSGCGDEGLEKNKEVPGEQRHSLWGLALGVQSKCHAPDDEENGPRCEL